MMISDPSARSPMGAVWRVSGEFDGIDCGTAAVISR
jgi:hypothetical protein